MATIEQRVAGLETAIEKLREVVKEWREKFVAFKNSQEAEAEKKAQDDERAKRKAKRR